jgi:hypothetical protein
MSKYKRNMRKCEAVFANRADYRGRRETAGDYLRLAGIALRAPEDPGTGPGRAADWVAVAGVLRTTSAPARSATQQARQP